jgi:flavin-dependent dehydrogenase
MNEANSYHVCIIGGGLAGLSAAISVRQLGHSVILFERERYPFNKVCGEYVSMESWEFLQSAGVPVETLSLPKLNTLMLTSPNGKCFTTKLPLGGFGISRFELDNRLAGIARKLGVEVRENTRVDDVTFNEKFTVKFSRESNTGSISADVCIGSFGKRSNLDIRWHRKFLSAALQLDNFVGVKYHVHTNWPENVIGLHNFRNGYCGISAVEGGKYCLCYMTTANELKKAGSIQQMEQQLLSLNPHLKKIFNDSNVLPGFPVTISQINFNERSTVENGILMTGDAAGMIAPLCGNGMSIALHSGKMASMHIHHFLSGKISRKEMEVQYTTSWKKEFAQRMKTGRMLQRFFGSESSSNFFVGIFRMIPFLAAPVIRRTHGKRF